MSYFDDVGRFHEKFELPREGVVPPRGLSLDLLKFRGAFLLEELIEFFQSFGGTHEVVLALSDARRKLSQASGRVVNGRDADPDCDVEKAADALGDLTYVVLGTAHMMGLPFDAVWDEIQRANMAKERAKGADDPRSWRRHSSDVVKPEGWEPPDHGPALKEATENWRKRDVKQ